ncbi:putative membrane protein [Thermoplasmatales archaeon BRNA1]|nr:putative membrane protein [Thermoplasmatales archaeon BRNA1]
MRDLQQQQAMQPMPKGTMIAMLFVLLIMMVVMQFREQIGKALDVVFHVIDFGGDNPVLTLVIGGLIMITLSTVIRSFLTDAIKMARTQHIQRQFQEEMRKARTENNLYKMKKLQEQQMVMTQASMEMSAQQMKSMPITMVVIIPIYAWVWYFINSIHNGDLGDPANLVIDLPWGTANLYNNVWFMPSWIIIYTLISLPIGQLENKLMQYILLGRKLKQLDAEEQSAARKEKI